MSRFYAEIKGGRGAATRCGDSSSGIWGHIRGWNVGAVIKISINEFGDDEVVVIRTGGSNNSHGREIVRFTESENSETLQKKRDALRAGVLYDEAEHLVYCPMCGAAEGNPCSRKNRGPRSPHKERVDELVKLWKN